MEISHRLYPYPVLSEISDDYLNSVFQTEVQSHNEGNELTLSIFVNLVNEELENLLSLDKIEIIHHFENSQTGFRKHLKTKDFKTNITFSKDNVSGRLNISSFLVVKDNIYDYSNYAFHSDYRGYTFDFEYGTILAIGTQYNLDIEKEDLDIVNKESIFTISKSNDKTKLNFDIDLIQDKIVIKINEEDFEKLSYIKNITFLQSLLNSILIVPALIDVLHRVINTPKNERDENYGGKIWYRTIRKALTEHFEIDIEGDVDPFRVVELAQKLVNSPISKSLSTLSDYFGAVTVAED